MTQPQGGDQFSLGNAVGYVDLNTSRATAALQGLRGTMQGFFQSTASGFQQMGATVSNFGSTLTLGILPVAGAFKSGISAAGNFQDALVEIQTRTRATDEEMQKIRSTALQLGADTVFSTQEAADAFLMLLTAGQSVEQALATLPQVLDGAAASGEDLGRTADFVTSTLASFNLAAEESQRVVDAMAKGAGASQATMGQMGEALQAVGGIATQYGISLEDTSAIMAIFAQRGIRGAEAGTQLRSMLRNMTEPTETTQAAWAKLGVSLFDAEGNMRNLDVVLQEIEASLATKTQEEQIEIINQIAGAYGQVGFSALLASDGIAAMRTQMDEQSSAHEIAAARMATFKGQVESLRGSIETLLITAFTPYIEFLTPMVEQTVKFVNTITKWVEANQVLVQRILRAISVLLILAPTLFTVGKAISLIGFLIGALVNPIQLVMVAITAFSMAWAANLGNIREITAQTVAFVREAFNILFSENDSGTYLDNPITRFLLNIRKAARQAFANLKSIFTTGWAILFAADNNTVFLDNPINRFFLNIRETIDRVFTSLRPLFGELQIFFGNLFANVDTSGFTNLISHVLDFGHILLQLTNPIGQISLLLRALGIDIFPILMNAFEAGAAIVTRFFQYMNNGVAPVDALKAALGNPQWLDSVIAGFTSLGNFVTGTVVPSLNQLRDWFLNSALPGIVSFVTGTVVPAIQNFLGRLVALWQQAQPGLSAIGSWFIDVGTQIWNIITTRIIPILMEVGRWLGDMWLIAAPHLQALADWFLLTAVPAIANFINTTFLPLVDSLLGALQRLWTDVSPFLTDLFDWFMNTALPPIVTFITETVMPLINDLIGLLGDIWELVSPALEALYDWFINTGLPAIMDFIEGPVTTAINAFIGILTGIYNTARDAINAIRDLIGLQGDQGLRVDTAQRDSAFEAARNRNNAGSGGQQVAFGTTIRAFATGTNLVPRDMLAMLHQGEAVIPAEFNPAAGGTGMGTHLEFHNGAVVIHANSYDEGMQAAQGFEFRLNELIRVRG